MTKAVIHSHNNNVAMVIECSVTLQKEQYKTWLSQDIILNISLVSCYLSPVLW